jgi:hypothetical protein
MFPLDTHPSIPNSLVHTLTNTPTLMNMCLVPLQLSYAQQLLGYMHQFGRITLETLGFIYYGMGSTIQYYVLDGGGGVLYR